MAGANYQLINNGEQRMREQQRQRQGVVRRA
jgi:hypothetical protein